MQKGVAQLLQIDIDNRVNEKIEEKKLRRCGSNLPEGVVLANHTTCTRS